MLVIRNFLDWHTGVGEVPWNSVLTKMIDCHSKLVLHLLRNNQPVQVAMYPTRQINLIFLGPSDQTDVLQRFEHAATCP